LDDNIVKVAVIGCGRVSGHHQRSIADVNGGEIVAVCDLDVEKAKTYALQYNIPYFDNYHQMLAAVPEVNVVAIVTPSGMHFEHATEIMERYRKSIIVEKPTFLQPSQLEDAFAMAEKVGVKIYPIFQNRYNKAVKRIKRALDEGELGKIRIVSVRVRWCRPQRYYDLDHWRGTFSHDGGALTNQGIHHVDLLRYLGGEVTSLNATMRTLGANIEVEDTVVSTMTFGAGAVGNLEVTTAARPDDFEASLSLVCENGLAQLGGLAVNELQVFSPDPDECEKFSEDIPDAYGYGHSTVYENIVADMKDEKPFPVDKEDCMKTIKLLDSFYRSDEAGSWIDPASVGQSTRLGRPNEEISNLYRTPLPE